MSQLMKHLKVYILYAYLGGKAWKTIFNFPLLPPHTPHDKYVVKETIFRQRQSHKREDSMKTVTIPQTLSGGWEGGVKYE